MERAALRISRKCMVGMEMKYESVLVMGVLV
jgi:hypothetical protein